jgi:hypothetical protein
MRRVGACVHEGSSRGGRAENEETPRFWSKQGSDGGSHGTPDLSLEGSSGDGGSATGLAPRGAVTVAGLCRNRTGFAILPRRCVTGLAARCRVEAYHRRGQISDG